jgi:hypothetical protein
MSERVVRMSDEEKEEKVKGVGPLTNLVLGYGLDGKGDGKPESGLEGVIDKILPSSDKTMETGGDPEVHPGPPPED